MLDSQEIPISICSHQNTEEETVKNATCTEKGEKRTICKDCGETVKTESIAALGHAFGEYKVAKEPTCDEKGEETSKCSRCDEEQTHEVAALGHENGMKAKLPQKLLPLKLG